MTGKSGKHFSLNENSKKITKRTPPTAHHDQKRSLNGLTMELRSQNAAAIFLQSSNTGNSNRLPGPEQWCPESDSCLSQLFFFLTISWRNYMHTSLIMLASLDCTAHIGQSKRGDWKEEVYQKVFRYAP
ncbi:hypothetical protein Pint_30224 [Pistacia integerrima]|uniref:Uncharacterized protein n=1 Tax=Pistacia integerrima TaxID=434235 RepID=A0ACC0X457_9ROSI|nr:hypothetical protein Pint_30224 [Pistacia integerrima]